jgi:hypothetical protein
MRTWASVSSTKCLPQKRLKNDELGEQTSGWNGQFAKAFQRLVPQMCIVQAVLTQLRILHV